MKYVTIVVFSLITMLVIAVMALLFAGLVSEKHEYEFPEDQEVAIVVNGYPVTTTEVLDMKAMSAATTAINRSDLENFRRIASEEYGEMQEQGLALADKHGIDVETLSIVIVTYANLTAALEAGYSLPSDSEVAETVREHREAYEAQIQEYEKLLEGNGYTEDGKRVILNEDNTITVESDGGSFSYTAYDRFTEANINATGGERYWTEVLPAELKRTMPTIPWREDALGPVQTEGFVTHREYHAEIDRAIDELHQQALADVQVEIRIPVLNATVEEAFAYMDESEELEEELRRRYPQFFQ